MNYGFREAYFEYFESCNFSRENTNIDVSVFMVDLRMINMSSECEYDWNWKISACLTEYEVCDSFASLTCQQTSYSCSAGWYFRYQSIHIQITYTYLTFDNNIIIQQSVPKTFWQIGLKHILKDFFTIWLSKIYGLFLLPTWNNFY